MVPRPHRFLGKQGTWDDVIAPASIEDASVAIENAAAAYFIEKERDVKLNKKKEYPDDPSSESDYSSDEEW